MALVLLTLFGSVARVLRTVVGPRAVFPGAARRPGDATALLQSAHGEPLWLDAGGARTEAWFLPPSGVARGPAPLLIYTHGNGELIDDWAREFDEVRSWGGAVLLVEYPGYGRSGRPPREAGIVAPILPAYDTVTRRPDVDPARV